ncbi:MAG: hypothetical protein RQ748_09045 [Elusimicrobiales bacterium]|nr:hypothetical protein [Elusimicrobiales bacterium]
MVLGGATIAAGVGVVYNFMGPASKPVYSPSLFQNAYQEEQAASANLERQRVNSAASVEPSTLDMFREQARKDGIGFGDGGGDAAAEGGEGAEVGAGASASADVAAPDPGGSYAQSGAGSGKGKLAASLGFGSKGGAGSGTSIPKMNTSGGLSGGIGQKFAPVYRPPTGQSSDMRKGASARLSNSPKYTVPNFNKKGAFGQAKYAGKMGAKAAYSASDAGAHTGATEAFAGETTGTGDVEGVPETGAGLGGAGVSAGDSLKANDPNLSMNESEPPAVPDPEVVDPWQAELDKAMGAMMWALGLIILTKILGKIAKKVPMVYYAAVATAVAAMFKALVVVLAGIKIMKTYGQTWMGGMYVFLGLSLMVAAWEALCGLEKGDAQPMKSWSLTGGKGLMSLIGLGK